MEPYKPPKQLSYNVRTPKFKGGVKPLNRSLSPPTFDFSPKTTIKRRYNCAGNVSGTFSIQSGNNQFLCATAAALCNCIADVWRVKSIEMWANFNTTNNNAYVQLSSIDQDTNQNSFNADPWQLRDDSTSTTYTAHIKKQFKKNTPEGAWHFGSTVNTGNALFEIAASSGAIIDIVYEVRFGFGAGGASFAQWTVVVAAANVGTLYCRIPITNMIPNGQNTI